jgi:hypothetical protein
MNEYIRVTWTDFYTDRLEEVFYNEKDVRNFISAWTNVDWNDVYIEYVKEVSVFAFMEEGNDQTR